MINVLAKKNGCLIRARNTINMFFSLIQCRAVGESGAKWGSWAKRGIAIIYITISANFLFFL